MPDNKGKESNQGNGKRAHASVYDVVAGRVGFEGFLHEPHQSTYRDLASTSNVPVPPEEVLFRRAGAPIRYEEDDIYEADRHLTTAQTLPDSDLLKIIHAYASDFYHRRTADGKPESFKSLDETALLAMGILLEEAADEALGATGDLAFVEGEGELHFDDHDKSMYWHEGRWKDRVINHDSVMWKRVLGHTRHRPARRNKKSIRVEKRSG
ncbi:Hypothetical protein R9X50_00671100 [Acrodontium crateriforme]|uniref:Uncharacterized protein n=1 Tax=Acrodontium crateriforme TaxID=150365 RepID=A0AAQ3MAK6_9PEZI|nr:Hypothetical protein R9X50_00671100 [Acrodontium crateriforme]